MGLRSPVKLQNCQKNKSSVKSEKLSWCKMIYRIYNNQDKANTAVLLYIVNVAILI